jgi:hypothetical protein
VTGRSDPVAKGGTVQLPKTMVVERIRSQSGTDAATRADAELPEKVDPDRDGELLRRLGVDPAALTAAQPSGQPPAVG